MRINVWKRLLTTIYENESLVETLIASMQERFAGYACPDRKAQWLSERDSVLITYGDTLKCRGEKGLATLKRFLDAEVGTAISTVHILPMFPFTSDDGFSVVDYHAINPRLGDWNDIKLLGQHYHLMFDAVVNHVSQEHAWFKAFLRGEEPYVHYFITGNPEDDYSSVTRARMHPLLTPFKRQDGTIVHVWTTFSDDQVDLNYACPDVLLEILMVLLSYANKGAKIIRLDAVGFLWKELGTTCMHLPKAHAIIKLMRVILEDYAPGTLLITETNVPQHENLTYFGEGDEAHLVYQFPLAPLIMFTLLSGNSERLCTWLKTLPVPRQGTTYFNFLSSHDGIGLRPVDALLSDKQRESLIACTLRNGGSVSYKANGNGTKTAYELNINYQDALSSPDEDDAVRIAKFMLSQTILLSLQGLPGIYIHSLLGSRNDYYGRAVSGIARRINREQLDYEVLQEALHNKSNRNRIFSEYIRTLSLRRTHAAFAVESPQEIICFDQRIFCVKRWATDGSEIVYALFNVSSEEVRLEDSRLEGVDILHAKPVGPSMNLQPYEYRWIVSQQNDIG
jgi:sucrose phosphorylase